eukprot:gnl/MRDRNA2_/MRDRNA2_120170_c0_seq1.p2 gnl/MRDRNA2_/MRDRNA2_120170_c0~~gnl/MRDRNA2_/MRDRNA2_120170_c0_seq1.p2  ORF type:complete len:230 (-),score=47.80 gnl/MRDRNA2_/MRDRNA2_120170_c0_seq1:73-762(-)
MQSPITIVLFAFVAEAQPYGFLASQQRFSSRTSHSAPIAARAAQKENPKIFAATAPAQEPESKRSSKNSDHNSQAFNEWWKSVNRPRAFDESRHNPSLIYHFDKAALSKANKERGLPAVQAAVEAKTEATAATDAQIEDEALETTSKIESEWGAPRWWRKIVTGDENTRIRDKFGDMLPTVSIPKNKPADATLFTQAPSGAVTMAGAALVGLSMGSVVAFAMLRMRHGA